MNQRLKSGDQAPPINSPNILGQEVRVLDPKVGLTHIQFQRFAGCPVCNLHLRDFIKRIDAVRDAGVREIVFFHSELVQMSKQTRTKISSIDDEGINT